MLIQVSLAASKGGHDEWEFSAGRTPYQFGATRGQTSHNGVAFFLQEGRGSSDKLLKQQQTRIFGLDLVGLLTTLTLNA
jgi:hypothetical protein